jgi:predicted DNA-binding protein (UPF0251 family)
MIAPFTGRPDFVHQQSDTRCSRFLVVNRARSSYGLAMLRGVTVRPRDEPSGSSADGLIVGGRELRALRLRFTTEGPEQAAERLGTSTRKVCRLVERAMDTCALRLEIEGIFRPCLDWHADVIAFVAGTAPALDESTEAHLAGCQACSHAVELLERAARQVAGVRQR